MIIGNILLFVPILYVIFCAAVVLFVGLWAERKPNVGIDHYLPTQYLAPALMVPAFIAMCGMCYISQRVDFGLFVINGAPSLVMDPFATLMSAIIFGGTFFVMILSLRYFGEEQLHKAEYYSLLMFAAAGGAIACASSELICLYLSIEFLTLLSYVLAAFDKRNRRSAEAGLKYFLFGSVASAVMVYGMSLIFGASGGQLSYTALSDIFANTPISSCGIGFVGILLLFVGFCFKVALVPVHFWAPDVYEGAPTPVTAFLSAVSKTAGVAAMLRFVAVVMYPSNTWSSASYWVMLVICVLSMFYGNLAAIWQSNIKRMLAYSSIAQVGFMIIGLLADMHTDLQFWGVGGMTMYLLVYAIMNMGAFAVITAVCKAIGSDEIKDYAGLIKRAPFYAVSLTIFLLSLAGIPPVAGFFTKLLVIGAAIKAGAYPEMIALAVIGVVNSVISVYYYFNVIRTMFSSCDNKEKDIKVSYGITVATSVLAFATVVFVVFAEPLINIIAGAVSGLLK